MLNVLNKGFQKIKRMDEVLSEYPHITKDGQWLTHKAGHWTGGFWVGLHWINSIYAEDPKLCRQKAVNWAQKLAVRKTDNKTHDMGFIFGPSCVLGTRIEPNEELEQLALSGAKNMRDLFDDRSGLILAWDEPGYEGMAIVDTIMNLPLMVWASKRFNESEFYRIAETVADNILTHHVRDDYSTYHTVRWDLDSFQIVEKGTHQGLNSESCWSRGQSWALYGFANMYRYTRKKEYLEAAIKLSEYFWDHLDDETKLPKWDFVFKDQHEEPIDASAASVAASGMLLLSHILKKDNVSTNFQIWEKRAETILNSMVEHCLYSDIDKYGIIEKATVDKPRCSGIGESTMYGDYYFMEALHRSIKGNQGDQKSLDLLY